ncbi:hypothetical protein OSTOST_16978, partial [Ostertagia ostertagi]
MDNVVCDIADDCPNGKDEESCDDQPLGARCDFDNEKSFCDGWTMLTLEQAKPITEHLLQVKRPMGNVGPIHTSRPGGVEILRDSIWNRRRMVTVGCSSVMGAESSSFENPPGRRREE